MAEPFTIIGAGAIGGIVGAHLHRAGHDIVFVESNRDHVAAIRRDGLRLSGALEATIHAPVLLPEEVRGRLHRVLLAVKARHTEAALAPVAGLLAEDGCVVSLQNGLEEYKIAAMVGATRTIGAYLTFGGHYRGPGDIVYGGPGSFRLGEMDGRSTARVRELRDILECVQPVQVTDNIFGFLWTKMALGAVYFATALVSADVPDIYANAVCREMLGSLAAEVVAVAAARGVRVEECDGFDPKVFRIGRPGDPAAMAASWDGQFRYWSGHGSTRTGVWRDLAQHHRPTEVEEQVGTVVRMGETNGTDVPRLRVLVRMIHEVEEARRQLGWHNLDELVALDRALAATA
jgi:2-dehydropantoate 2-reductase